MNPVQARNTSVGPMVQRRRQAPLAASSVTIPPSPGVSGRAAINGRAVINGRDAINGRNFINARKVTPTPGSGDTSPPLFELNVIRPRRKINTGPMVLRRRHTPILIAPSSMLDGLVAYYKLDEASGNALDAHTVGLDLTATSAPTADTGALNGCRVFGGSNYFSRTPASQFDVRGAKDFLISCWLNLPSSISSSLAGVFAVETDSFNSPLVLMFAPNFSKISMDINDGDEFVQLSTPTIAVDTWFHLLAWRSLADGQIGLRVNNSEEATATVASSYSIGGSGALTVYLASGGIYANNAVGKMDESAVWLNKTKSTASAAVLYNGGAPLPYASLAANNF